MRIHNLYKRIFVFLTLFLLIISTSCAALEYPCTGIANASSVRVRKKSSTSGAQVTTLKKGESVTVLEETVKNNGDIWYKIETQKGKTGYILSDYLSIPETDRITAAENAENAVQMQLTISAHCSDYNSVGKKWTQYYEWNGMQAQDGTMTAYVAPDVELSVYARIREQDSAPDTNTEKTLYTPTAEEALNGFEVTQKIAVTENGGKYKGNTAYWTITFTFAPISE